MPLRETDNIPWASQLIRTTESKELVRTGVSPPQMHELIGVDGSIQGGVRPSRGMKRAYEFRYYNVTDDVTFSFTPNDLHDFTAVVNDFFPFQMKVGTDGYAYGFVYRSIRSNPADGFADVFIDFWNSKVDTTEFGTTGSVIMEKVSVTAQMDVRVFGRLVFVFLEGRSPALFYIKETTEKSYVATEDTWLDEQNPTVNNSTGDPGLTVDLDNSTSLGGLSKHGLMRFDASAEQGLTVSKAELDFQVEESFLDDVTYKFARPVSAWVEAEADWDEFANGSAWPGGGGGVGDAVTTDEGSIVLLGGSTGQTSGAIGQHTVEFTVGGAGPIDFGIAGSGIVNLLVYPEATQLLENLRRVSAQNALNPQARPTLRITYTTNFYELIKVGVTDSGLKPGPGKQPTLSSPLTGAVLGGLVPGDFDDTNRGGIGQLVLSVQTPGETGLFPDSNTGLCVTEVDPKGGGQEAGAGGGTGFPVIEYQETHVFLSTGGVNDQHIFGPNPNYTFTADQKIGPGEKIVIIYAAELTVPEQNFGSLEASLDHIDYLADGVNVPGNPLSSFEIVKLFDDANDETGVKIFLINNQPPYPKPINGSAIRITLRVPHAGAVVTVMKLSNCSAPTDAQSDEDDAVDIQSAIVPGLNVEFAGSLAVSVHNVEDPGGVMNPADFTYGPGQGLIDKKEFIGTPGGQAQSISTFQQAPDVVPSLPMEVNWLNPPQVSICAAVVFKPLFGSPPGCPTTAAGAMALLGFNNGFFGGYRRPPTPMQNAENVPVDDAPMEWTPLKLFPTANGDIGNPSNYIPIPNDGLWSLVMTGSKRVGGVDIVLDARPPVDLAAVAFDLTTMEPALELDENTTYTFALELKLTTEDCGEYIVPALLSPIHTGVQPLTFTTGGGPQPNARTFAAGDYAFAYILFDSKTGRRSALSEIAQIRAFDFPGNDGQPSDPDDPDPTVPLHFFALEVVYDPDKYDQLLAYRSVNTSESGGLFAAGYLFLDKVVVLKNFHTCENLEGGVFDDADPDNPLGLRQAIYYYTLEDKQLIYQDSYTDRAVFDEEMPHGGAALMYEGAMLVSKIPDPPLSTTDEVRVHDANRGVGELRWSSLTEVSPELFPPFNRYVPNVETNQIIRMEKVGGSAIGFSLDKLYHIRRHNVYILIQEMHEGLGIVNQRAVASAGSMLYFVTTKGLKAIDGSGRMDDVRHLNSLIIEDWKLTQQDIKVAFDSLAGCLFIHNANSGEWKTAVLWFATSMITEMHDMVFDDVRAGVWPREYVRTVPDVVPLTSPDFDNELTERALWIQNTPQPTHADSDPNFRPRIYYYDYLGSKTLSGEHLPADNGEPAIRVMDSLGPCRGQLGRGYGITAIDTTGPERHVELDLGIDGGIPRDLHNMYLYIVQAANPLAIGTKYRLLAFQTVAGTVRRLIAADNDDFLAWSNLVVVGDRFVLSPIYFRVVAPNVGIVDPDTGQIFGKSFNRARLINSVGAAFTDVKGPPGLDALRDNFFQGLVFEGTLVDPASKQTVVDVDGDHVASVVNGEGTDYAAFGSTDPNTEGKYGIKGNALSPGLEVFCPDLDFRLLEMVARGKILGVERSRMTRSI